VLAAREMTRVGDDHDFSQVVFKLNLLGKSAVLATLVCGGVVLLNSRVRDSSPGCAHLRWRRESGHASAMLCNPESVAQTPTQTQTQPDAHRRTLAQIIVDIVWGRVTLCQVLLYEGRVVTLS
jgi:hypothetical protein